MTSSPIRLLLVDDHPSSREPLAELLGRQPDLAVAGEAGSLAEARALLTAGLAVDVALVDLDLPDGNGAELIRDLRRRNTDALALVLTASRDRVQHARAVAAGAAGVLHKSAPIRGIVDAIRRLHEGEALLEAHEVAELVALWSARRGQDEAVRAGLAELTPRERDVLAALAEGLGDKAIAERLSLSDRTVRNHVVAVLNKLGVDSRLQALVLAVRLGAVRIE